MDSISNNKYVPLKTVMKIFHGLPGEVEGRGSERQERISGKKKEMR